MTSIQHRMPNPVHPAWVALSVVALVSMAYGFYRMTREKEDSDSATPDAEVIPPSAWNMDPNTGGEIQFLMADEQYTAVFTGPLVAPEGSVPAYVIEYDHPDAFTVLDADFEVGFTDGEPTHSVVTVHFIPHMVNGKTTNAFIRATAPDPVGTFRQLHLEIA